MRIDILTVLPELLTSPFEHSIIKRAQDKKLVEIFIHDIRYYSEDKHKRVDDYAYGGDAGMVMTIQPVDTIIGKLKSQRTYDEIIYLTPDAPVFCQREANLLSTKSNIILLCGHYKGIDQRIRDHLITKEISIGDYVLSGGEYAAIIVTDCIVRIIPGVISDETSALTDSFQDNMLAPPIYTRPYEYNGWKVPDVLLSGHKKNIEEWQFKQALKHTQHIRPDLLDEN